MTTILENLTAVKKLIRDSELRYNRSPGSTALLAVSKTQSINQIKEAITAGQLAFGENYLQEALPKITALVTQKIEWHFIGPIQSNKTKAIAENFSWVHSVSELKIAKRLNDQRPSHLPPLNICLQVNISQEPTKSGVHPDETMMLATAVASLPRLHLRGLMTISVPHTSFTEQRDLFHTLRLLQEKLCHNGFTLDTLSMGMSDDLEAAIAEGATWVRVGTAIFGKRKAT